MPLALRHSFVAPVSMMASAAIRATASPTPGATCIICELTFVEEELKQAWARNMKELLLDMKAEVEQAKALGQHELDVLLLARLLRRYDSILAQGYQANPPPAAPKQSEHAKRAPG